MSGFGQHCTKLVDAGPTLVEVDQVGDALAQQLATKLKPFSAVSTDTVAESRQRGRPSRQEPPANKSTSGLPATWLRGCHEVGGGADPPPNAWGNLLLRATCLQGYGALLNQRSGVIVVPSLRGPNSVDRSITLADDGQTLAQVGPSTVNNSAASCQFQAKIGRV